ncbi:PEP-CTERM protein-sorting domain-containing protein [Nitrosospira sp. Nsp18]|uniref:FxDxF family PEP-CTERM protein n=1 Tax=Nitrosospira sp. Nsp18 TaxID=1855334 RepID=UPI00088681ED|nr:FxDxF family PEP-CTERM protein [Nitrosospira sp. Nsp18]SDA25408.1 PEP-CTERM protein-sorting domain-containing protein [Nitrosospira sp. Nsp18]
MNKFSLKQIAAVAVLAGASVGANATTTSLGTISSSTPTTFTGVIQGAGIGINDIFTFNFEQPNLGSGYDVVNIPLTFSNGNFNTALATMTLVSNDNGIVGDFDDHILQSTVLPSPGNSSDNLGLRWDQPITGPAYINITGVTNGSQGGIYAGAIAAAVVPEPETYAMLLAGLGLMGAVVRRRSRKTS